MGAADRSRRGADLARGAALVRCMDRGTRCGASRDRHLVLCQDWTTLIGRANLAACVEPQSRAVVQ